MKRLTSDQLKLESSHPAGHCQCTDVPCVSGSTVKCFAEVYVLFFLEQINGDGDLRSNKQSHDAMYLILHMEAKISGEAKKSH